MEKRKKIFIIALFVLAFAGLVVSLFSPAAPYTLPFTETEVESVSFCYDNQASQKVITAPSDVSLVCSSLNALSLKGKYKRIPTGGQTIFLVFYLKDGTNWACTYYQQNAGTGFFADGNVRHKVSNLDLVQLWHQMSYLEETILGDMDFTPPPLE